MAPTGEVVAEHTLVAPGEASVRDEHYGGPRPAARAVRPKTAAEKAFCALGRVVEAFISGAAATGATRLGAGLAELNTLRAAHGEQAFLAALDRAVAFSRPHLGNAGHLLMFLAGGEDIHEPNPSTGVHGVEFVPGQVVADRSPATPPSASSSARSEPGPWATAGPRGSGPT